MIPKLSAPLTKLIRTLEGLIWLGANLALIIAPIVSSSVSPADSIQWGAIMNTIAFASRTALKGVAIAKGAGLPAPAQLLTAYGLTTVENVAGSVAGSVAKDISQGTTVDAVLAQIAAAEAAAATIQAKPGTPAAEIAAGSGLAADAPAPAGKP